MCACIVNHQCEYDEFKEINKSAFLAECKNPYFLWKNKFATLENLNL